MAAAATTALSHLRSIENTEQTAWRLAVEKEGTAETRVRSTSLGTLEDA